MKHCFTLIFTWLVVTLGLPGFVLGQSPRLVSAPVRQPIDPGKSLQFIENKNQWDASVRFMAPIPGGKFYLQANSLVFAFADNARFHEHGRENRRQPASRTIKTHAYSVSFVGAGQPASVAGRGATEGYRNYFIGNDP